MVSVTNLKPRELIKSGTTIFGAVSSSQTLVVFTEEEN